MSSLARGRNRARQAEGDCGPRRTAAQALLGPKFRVTKQRGQFIEFPLAPYLMATVHPSSILRAPDDETRKIEHRRFINDLKKLARVLS